MAAVAEIEQQAGLLEEACVWPVENLVWPVELPATMVKAMEKQNLEENSELQMEVVTVEDAVQHYGMKFGKQMEEELLGYNRTAFPWGNMIKEKEDRIQRSAEEVKSAFEKDLEEAPVVKVEACAEPRKRYRFQTLPSNCENREEDSDGEEVWLCRKCHLPLGDIRYTEEDEDRCKANGLHGECMAQGMLAKMGSEDAKKHEDDRKEKMERHEAYGIGWKTEHIPRNSAAVGKLAMREVPQGMVCLVFDEETRQIGIASTLEPAAAVNLEYLSVALQVRRKEGHEPVFSLDPVTPHERHPVHEKHSMQEKVFVPDWLAGTSVGEVLFQADYHLKELSMGEFDQPVVGMKSCFDLSEMEEELGEWQAREWFLVRKAEMQISENNALIPFVKMAVEAREQVVKGKSLLDKPVTRPDHPMVKYAEAFTKNFDLIAERKSVIFHLRELAKTSIVAKFLLDAGVQVEESWFNLYSVADEPTSMEVPQLWNEKLNAKLQVGDKSIETDKTGKGTHTHGVYGGVNFGLDKFNLTTSMAATRGAAAGLKAGLQASVKAGMPAHRLSVMGPLARRGFVPTAAAASQLSQLPTLAPSTQAGLSAMRPAAGVQMVTPSLGKAAALVPSRVGIPDLATPGLVPAARQLAAVEGLLPRAALAPGAPSSLTAYGRQFAPPGISGVAPPRMPAFGAPSASVSAVGAPRLQPGALTAALAAPRLTSQLVPPTISMGAAQALGAGMPAAPQLQGVDLRLDNFDLSSVTRVSMQTQGSWCSDVRDLDDCMAIGDGFWSSLDDTSNKVFQDDDRDLLRSIFNPSLCDRRAEGDLFCPPDASHSYVTKLRNLVKLEESVLETRKEQFFSKTFVMNEPGAAFPASWTSSLAVSRGKVRVSNLDSRPRGALIARPEYNQHAAELLDTTLKFSTPVFDKSTEEGVRFRVYRLGSLEIRTTQELDGDECIGAVFSVRNLTSTSGNEEDAEEQISLPPQPIDDQEKIIHATEFVERAFVNGGKPSALRRYYLVLETENGHTILLERLPNGTVTWEENPAELEDRNSLAKVTRASACQAGVIVQDLKTYQATVAKGASQAGVASPSVCKRFARSAYTRAVGSESRRGFISTPWWMDVAKEKMEAQEEEKAKNKSSFISLPNNMLKKA